MALGRLARGGIDGRRLGERGQVRVVVVVRLGGAGMGVGGRAVGDGGLVRLLLHAGIGTAGTAPGTGVCAGNVEVDAILAALRIGVAGLAPYAPLVTKVT